MSQTGTPSQIKLGIADVSFGGNNLGHTVGDTIITITTEQVDINVDDYGQTPLDSYEIGTQVQVVVPLAEYSLENMGYVIPGAQTGQADRVKVGRQAGTKLTAGKLILAALATGDLNFTVYRAQVMEIGDVIYANSQRTVPVTFKGLIDTTRPDGDRLFRIGGPSS